MDPSRIPLFLPLLCTGTHRNSISLPALLSVEGGTGQVGAEVGTVGAEFVWVRPEGRTLLIVRLLELAALLLSE
jgi:hypothetical protein